MALRAGRPAHSSRVVLRELHKRLAQGWPAGLTVLSGDDLYHLDIAQRALLAALLPEHATEFALTVYGEAKTDVGLVVAAARSAGMFTPLRVVLVRDVACLEGDPAPLAEFAERPPAQGFLLVRAPDLDRRRKLHQLLATAGTRLVFAAPDAAGEVAVEVRALAEARELSLDAEAATFLGELCGGDLYRVSGELDKIRDWVGERGRVAVDSATLRETAAGSGLLTGWEVADAVLERDGRAAAESLRRLLGGGEEPLRLLGAIAFRARAMLRAKALIEAGSAPQAAFRAARLWGPGPAAISRGLSHYTLRDLLGFPAELLRADRDLKSRSIAGGTILEAAVLRLIAGAGESAGGAR